MLLQGARRPSAAQVALRASLLGALIGAGSSPLQACTTILVGKGAAKDGSVMMGHNEDMGSLSGRLLFHPREAQTEKAVRVNYVTLPQVPETCAYWASGNSEGVADALFDGGWVLCGMNQWGVSISCNTVMTREEPIVRGKGLSRYSIRQLLLERAKTAFEGVELVGTLIDDYGQSDIPVAYCVADRDEAWLLESTYRHWVARRIKDNEIHVEVNEYSIETEYDAASDGVVAYAEERGWYDRAVGPFNFRKAYGHPEALNLPANVSRWYQGTSMLSDKQGSITVPILLSVLSQPPVQTTGTQAFMVWQLRRGMPTEIACVMWHGMGGANTSIAVPVYLGSTLVPEAYGAAPVDRDSQSAWWQFEELQTRFYPRMWEHAERYPALHDRLQRFQQRLLAETENFERELLSRRVESDAVPLSRRVTDYTYQALESALKEVLAAGASGSATE